MRIPIPHFLSLCFAFRQLDLHECVSVTNPKITEIVQHSVYSTLNVMILLT